MKNLVNEERQRCAGIMRKVITMTEGDLEAVRTGRSRITTDKLLKNLLQELWEAEADICTGYTQY